MLKKEFFLLFLPYGGFGDEDCYDIMLLLLSLWSQLFQWDFPQLTSGAQGSEISIQSSPLYVKSGDFLNAWSISLSLRSHWFWWKKSMLLFSVMSVLVKHFKKFQWAQACLLPLQGLLWITYLQHSLGRMCPSIFPCDFGWELGKGLGWLWEPDDSHVSCLCMSYAETAESYLYPNVNDPVPLWPTWKTSWYPGWVKHKVEFHCAVVRSSGLTERNRCKNSSNQPFCLGLDRLLKGSSNYCWFWKSLDQWAVCGSLSSRSVSFSCWSWVDLLS